MMNCVDFSLIWIFMWWFTQWSHKQWLRIKVNSYYVVRFHERFQNTLAHLFLVQSLSNWQLFWFLVVCLSSSNQMTLWRILVLSVNLLFYLGKYTPVNSNNNRIWWWLIDTHKDWGDDNEIIEVATAQTYNVAITLIDAIFSFLLNFFSFFVVLFVPLDTVLLFIGVLLLLPVGSGSVGGGIVEIHCFEVSRA